MAAVAVAVAVLAIVVLAAVQRRRRAEYKGREAALTEVADGMVTILSIQKTPPNGYRSLRFWRGSWVW